MTSYQRRLKDIKYYKQCIRELREITRELVYMLKKNDIKIPLLPSKGVEGTDLITPYNSGDFMIDITTEIRIKLEDL